jgi:hypothetical protein
VERFDQHLLLIPYRDILVSDSNGNQTGFDPRSGQSYSSIPASLYFLDGLEDADTGISSPDVSHQLYIAGTASQNYTVSVIANTSGPFNLLVTPYNSAGELQTTTALSGTLMMGTVTQYSIASGVVTPFITPTPIPVSPTPTPVLPTPSPTPIANPTPSQNSILTLTQDRGVYSAGNTAQISVAVNSSFVQPVNSTLSINAYLNGIQDQSILTVSKSLFEISTPALSSGSTMLEVTAILTTEPPTLSAIDNEIANLKAKSDIASGIKRFWDEVAVVALEVVKGLVSVFQHPTTQTLEIDSLFLIAN